MILNYRVQLDQIVQKAFSIFKFVREGIGDYIFPKNCFGCRQEGEYLCSACFNKIEYLNDLVCFLCHRIDFKNGICPDCAQSSCIDQIVVATAYTDNFVGRQVEGLKYDFVEELSEPLAKILIEQINRQNLAETVRRSMIVPIPLHRKRLIERGFNQAEALAKLIAMKYDNQVEIRLLRRSKETAQQAKLSRSERRENVQGAFMVEARKTMPETVILIDDVLTTGATFMEAAKCLKSAGVSKVICLAVCHG